MDVAFGADVLVPPDLLPRLGAPIILGDGPGTRQRMVDGGDLVVEKVRIGLVQVDALPDDALVVAVERNAADVVVAPPLETEGFHEQRVVAAVPILVDPAADRI